jgi:hypothetical protein
MTDLLQEFCDSRGVTVRVDRPASAIRGVKVLGLESRNGRTYLPEALAQAAVLYEDAKVNVNHPRGNPSGPRDYQDRIGAIRNVVVRPGEGLFADFHFNPKHALAEQLVWDAEHSPENVGFSHNVEARVARVGERVVVEAITRVQSVDLVADPATTRGLFESEDATKGTVPFSLRENRDSPQLREDRDSPQDENPQNDNQDGSPVELEQLRQEVDRLRALEAAHRKRETAGRLLREFDLPDPDASDPWAKTITSESFLESLSAAADECGMRKLVEDRARLVRMLEAGRAARDDGDRRPKSRDQHAASVLEPLGVKSFVEAIT